jgi:transcription-repair coupling factor (superfamily II helicase)
MDAGSSDGKTTAALRTAHGLNTSATITIGGAPEGYDAHLVLKEIASSNAPVLHVARDDKRMAIMKASLQFFAPEMPVLSFPGWDCLPYDRISPNADISAARMATLAGLVHVMPTQFVVLTTLNAASQRLPARSVLREGVFTAEVGQRINEAELKAFLVRMGFTQAPTVMEPGDYAVRGGIIDVYPPGESGPVRLDLFGDVLDGARRFDPATQRTTEKLNVVEFSPVSEVILDPGAITRFRQNYRIEFGAGRSDDPLYEAISAGRKHQVSIGIKLIIIAHLIVTMRQMLLKLLLKKRLNTTTLLGMILVSTIMMVMVLSIMSRLFGQDQQANGQVYGGDLIQTFGMIRLLLMVKVYIIILGSKYLIWLMRDHFHLLL